MHLLQLAAAALPCRSWLSGTQERLISLWQWAHATSHPHPFFPPTRVQSLQRALFRKFRSWFIANADLGFVSPPGPRQGSEV